MPTLTIDLDLPDNVTLPSNWDARSFVLEKENRRRLEEEARRNPPKRTKEEMIQLLINLPMPDEETIKRQDEVREHIRQWKLPW
jgi:hypothetical protein